MSTTSYSAILFDDAETGPVVTEVTVREPAGREVLVRMEASGLCHSDLHVVLGEWPFDYRIVLGHEGAGRVEAVGPDVDDLAVGQRVIVNWYASCGSCRECDAGKPYLCVSTSAIDNVLPDGTTPITAPDGIEVRPLLGVGTHAEYSLMTREAVVPVPDEVPADVAAIIGCAVTTGVGAVLNTAQVQAGQSAVVVGAGGVGQSIIMGLKLAGAHPIVAVDLSDDRLEAAREFGATAVFRGDDPELNLKVAELTEGGADFAFDAIGHPSTSANLPNLIRNGGAAVIVGMPARDAEVPFLTWPLVAANKRILGCNYGSSNPAVDFPKIAGLYLAGKLPLDRLIDGHIPLGDYPAEIRALAQAKGRKKVVDYSL
ncbi:alcohol dehydrogenase catalytic domain-containing protein [Herbiconiux sp. KACC 21604]|uniref:alcohol dehydrogenase catalytic domain-containing protein n=1 Tax=unclassified Herbiconiux TaxID=2618217 RepID=UPI001490A7F1|nr:alcohol dehydrogenase catalytic domain-containing protein [Herbiconiux sp. SALV-R1]QJU53461.1 alcohol dehydrogenase catalytic domain-containing protein [Herbiconiux sp. SALV-R1]WPO88433.1 alcohol dehydrogenase catalytic domain-containing protein [Herbiconiux sp. KACC 21604]